MVSRRHNTGDCWNTRSVLASSADVEEETASTFRRHHHERVERLDACRRVRGRVRQTFERREKDIGHVLHLQRLRKRHHHRSRDHIDAMWGGNSDIFCRNRDDRFASLVDETVRDDDDGTR